MDSVNYEITLDDREATYREPSIRRALLRDLYRQSRWRLPLVAALGAAGAATIAWRRTPPGSTPNLPAMVGLGCLGALLASLVYVAALAGRVRRYPSLVRAAIARGIYGEMTGRYSATLRDDALAIHGPQGESVFLWIAIQRIHRGDHGLLFVLGPVSVVLIPHRSFAGGGSEAFESKARTLHAKATAHTRQSPPSPR